MKTAPRTVFGDVSNKLVPITSCENIKTIVVLFFGTTTTVLPFCCWLSQTIKYSRISFT